MSRINAIEIETAEGKAKELLKAVKAKLGFAPNLMKTLANSPAALEGYLSLNTILGSTLNAKLREEIALVTAQSNGCAYCASAHTALGKLAGLSEEETRAAQKGEVSDPKHTAALNFAKTVINERGKVSDQSLREIREAGFSDGEITEIVGHVALNVFTNYFNEVAKTEIDFPRVEILSQSVAA